MQAITDIQITNIEAILLPAGKTFDPERRQFISELSTCDLQAVPGSGKTTVLLAKLMAFEKQLPLSNGRGILVISHTNTAVNEIREKLGAACPNLLSYPNFIGTIQSFVDQFLATPYYSMSFGKKPIRIDNEIYEEKVIRYPLAPGAKAWVGRRIDPEGFLKGLRLNSDYKLAEAPNFTLFNSISENTDTYKALLQMKLRLLENGYLCFDDAYVLAEQYLSKQKGIISLLRKRFAYVFVDEMQDMDKRQHDLLETIFFSATNETSYQRIGDRNQSIFSDSNEEDLAWSPRGNTHVISGSQRLSQHIANAVRPFGLYTDTPIDGRNNSQLKPHILLYDDNSPQAVLPYFADLVKQYRDNGQITNLVSPVKAIGWVGKIAGENISIPSYFPEYNSERKVTKIDYPNFLSYICSLDVNAKSFSLTRKCILNAILRVLRGCNIQNGTRDFTKAQFLSELKITRPDLYLDFNHNLYLWCKDIVINENINQAHERIKDYLPTFLYVWKGLQNLDAATTAFINSTDILGIQQVAETPLPTSVFKHNGIDIDVTTIHAVKGETHAATLYLETYYYNYEIDKCLQQFFATSSTLLTGKRKKVAAKMMYVGFSRPTCLLCYASSKSRMLQHKAQLEANGWVVLEV